MDLERRRLRYRAWRRGTREMDLLLGGYVDSRLEAMDAAMMRGLRGVLALSDPEIEDWLKRGVLPDGISDAEILSVLKDLREDYSRAAGLS